MNLECSLERLLCAVMRAPRSIDKRKKVGFCVSFTMKSAAASAPSRISARWLKVPTPKFGVATIALALALGCVTVPARADVITLTFADLPLSNTNDGVAIENYYDGGLSGYQSPSDYGPQDGLTFSGNETNGAIWGGEELRDITGAKLRSGARSEDNPSGTDAVLYWAFHAGSGPQYVIDAANGFTGFSVNYALNGNSRAYNTSIELYSGLNGTGRLLDTINLVANNNTVACRNSGDEFCTWSLAEASRFGEAESAVFGTDDASMENLEFDNLTFTPVPEPSGLALLSSGLAGLGLATFFARHSRRIATSHSSHSEV